MCGAIPTSRDTLAGEDERRLCGSRFHRRRARCDHDSWVVAFAVRVLCVGASENVVRD